MDSRDLQELLYAAETEISVSVNWGTILTSMLEILAGCPAEMTVRELTAMLKELDE